MELIAIIIALIVPIAVAIWTVRSSAKDTAKQIAALEESTTKQVESINGLVNYEGESVKEITEAFHEAVDDYLAYCKDEGIEPDKSYTGVLNVRLTPAIHRQIAMLARQAGLIK